MATLPNGVESWFTKDTLALVRREPCPVVVADLLYFRTGSSARMEEPGGRRFTTFLRLENGAPAAFQCTCPHRQSSRDMCRHVALLYLASVEWNERGEIIRLRAERFEASLWFGVLRGIQLDLEEARLDHDIERDGDELYCRTLAHGGTQLELKLRAPDERVAVSVVSAWPADVRPDGFAVDQALEGRETLLRRHEKTNQETMFESRGLPPTARQLWESSFWFRLSRVLFELFGDGSAGDAKPKLSVSRGAFHLSASSDAAEVRVRLTDRAIEALLQHPLGTGLLKGAGFKCEEGFATPSLRITLEDDHSLRLAPAIVVSGKAFDRDEIERRPFGRWLFFDSAKLFTTIREVPRLFPEEPSEEQATFGFGSMWKKSASGVPYERVTVIPPDEVFDFIARHREAIAEHPPALLGEGIAGASPVTGDAVIDLAILAREADRYEVGVTWHFGEASIGLNEVLAARKAKRRVLVSGTTWLSLSSPSFAWLEDLDREAVIGKKDKHLVLRPIDILRVHASAAEVRLLGDDELTGSLSDLAALRASVRGPEPDSLGVPLYPYQENGYRWLWFLQQNGLGGLLCDDMGLGKTHQAMALMGALAAADPAARFLVICPTSVIDHWRRRVLEYLGHVTVETFLGGPPGAARCIIASYGMARNHAGALGRVRWDLLVLDEIQTIKNRSTATYKALASLRKRIAVGLTGTPVENHVGELRTLLDFVQPGYLPAETAFERRFAGPIERDEPGARARLARLINPFVLRRTKKQVLPELPDKIVDTRYCELTEEQKELYREVLEGRGKDVRKELEGGGPVSYLHVFAVLNYLKQVCNHPALFHNEDDPDRYPSGKWELFTEMLEESLESGLKVVVFSQYVSMLRLIERHLERSSVGYATIKGDTRDRPAMLRRFASDDDCRVFTASLKAGGVGIDLTAASVVIHYDRWWNQAREDQATDRVHRIGQNRGVQVLRLITRNTLEEKIDAIIRRKHALASDLVREDDPTLAKQFTREELRELLEA
jgi:superfamily II DNA or RNA helicase